MLQGCQTMSQSVHLIVAKKIGYYRIHSHVKIRGLKCVGATFVSKAERNPDFSWQNKNRLSRSRNWSNDQEQWKADVEKLSRRKKSELREGADIKEAKKVLDEHDRKIEAELHERAAIIEEKIIEASRGQGKENSTKNGPLVSLSTSGKYQATAAPGPSWTENWKAIAEELSRKNKSELRERADIKEAKKVLDEHDRKIEAELRERAAIIEEKIIEASRGQGKENSMKNGPLVSLSTSGKYQATAAPGPIEQATAGHIRKIEAALRERAAIKEEKKVEASRGQGKENSMKNGPLVSLSTSGKYQAIAEHIRKIEAEAAIKEEKKVEASRGQGKENSMKNGPLVSLSTSRVNEIRRDLFGNWAGWPESAAIKEEKKVEASRRQGKENSAVDSLLKLFKKHSVEQVKRSSGGGRGKDFSLDQLQESNQFNGERSTKFSDLGSAPKDESLEANISSVARTRSNLQRWSPVPRVKYQPLSNNEDDMNVVPISSGDGENNQDQIDLKLDDKPEPDSEFDFEELFFPEIAESRTDMWIAKLSEDDSHDSELTYNDERVEEQLVVQHEDLSALKLSELKALAKSRGLKGFSKLKKGELKELLSES